MEIRDLIVTPIYGIIIFTLAYIIRPYVTDNTTRKYFLPGLAVRIFGALALGFIYQFYYHGGDTYNFHTHGSRHIWEAFIDAPEKGLQMIFGSTNTERDIYKYSSKIPFFHDQSSYTIIRVAGLIDLFTFSSYSATALVFAVFGFAGSWLMYLTFNRKHSDQSHYIALATLFIPSVFFWGSGLLKDTLTLGAIGISTHCSYVLFVKRKFKIAHALALVLCFYLIFVIKKYILMCFLPAILCWFFWNNLVRIKSTALKILIFPLVFSLLIATGYVAVVQVSKDDPRYNLKRLGYTAKETAYDIAFQTGRDAGSTYALGELDGSLTSLFSLTPQAINVSLFRPYLLEVKNPLMAISSIESTFFLLLTVFVLIKTRGRWRYSLSNPEVIFCFVFSITFAFAVGVTSYNFGTLSRYKIPLMPFYLVGLILFWATSNKDKKAV